MGLVLNPVAFRIGHFHSWTDAWYMHRIYYPEFLHNVLLLKTLMFFLFYDMLFMDKFMFFLYSHINLYFKNDRIFLNIYVYDCTDRTFFYDWLNHFKYSKFRKISLRTFWLKKELLNYNKFGQDFFLLLNNIGIHIDYMTFENIDVKHSWRLGKKIQYLRTKYGDDFIAREEIFMLKRLMSFFKDGYYKFGSLFAIRYFLKWYFKKTKRFNYNFNKNKRKNLLWKVNYKVKNLKLKKNKFINKGKKNFLTAWLKIKSNYIFLFLILSIFDLFLSRSSPRYPYVIDLRRLEHMYVIRFFHYWFLLRPIYLNYSFFIELLIMRFGIRVYNRFFVLNNSCIIALFIARFIALGIYSRFSFKDLMIPIRRSLHRLMYVRIHKRVASNVIDIYNKKRIYKVKKDFMITKFYLKNRITFFVINFVIRLNEIKRYFKYLYFKKYKYNLYIFKKKYFNFFYINKFMTYLRMTILLKKNIFYLKFFFNKIYIKKTIRNFFLKLKNLVFNIKKKFFNYFYLFDNFIFLKFFFSYKLQFYLCTCYFFFKLLCEFYFFRNLKFFQFLVFKQFYKRLYYKSRMIPMNFMFKNYKKFIYEKLKRKKIINWKIYKLKNLKFKNYKEYFTNLEFYNLFFKLLFYKKKSLKIILKNNEKYKKYLLILRLLKKKLKITDDEVKRLLMYERSTLKRLINLKKIVKKALLKRINKKKKWRFIMKKQAKLLKLKRKKLKEKIDYSKLKRKSIVKFYLNNIAIKRNLFFKSLKFKKINFIYMSIYKKFLLKFYMYNKFPINIRKMLDYINNLDNVEYYFFKKLYDVNKQIDKQKIENEVVTPLKYKLKRRKFLDRSKAILYGYKFHFKGRFKRKQKSSNLWFVKGSMANSTMNQDVDRGFFTFYSMFGACTVRVWLYKSDNAPKYIIRVN